MLKRRLQRLVGVYTCQNVKLLEISCTGPIIIKIQVFGVFSSGPDSFVNTSTSIQ